MSPVTDLGLVVDSNSDAASPWIDGEALDGIGLLVRREYSGMGTVSSPQNHLAIGAPGDEAEAFPFDFDKGDRCAAWPMRVFEIDRVGNHIRESQGLEQRYNSVLRFANQFLNTHTADIPKL